MDEISEKDGHSTHTKECPEIVMICVLGRYALNSRLIMLFFKANTVSTHLLCIAESCT